MRKEPNMSLYTLPKPHIPQFEQNQKKPKKTGVEILIFLLVAFIAMIPQSVFSVVYTAYRLLRDPAFWELASSGASDAEITLYTETLMANLPSGFFVTTLACSGFMILAAILYCRIFEKRPPSTLGFTKKGVLVDYGLGAIVGFIMIALPIGICILTGTVSLTFSKTADILTVLLFLAAFLIQGMGEEALFRGYLLTTLTKRNGIWQAVFINSALFAVFHIGNAGFNLIAFLNIMLFGIFASVITLKRKSIWAAGAIHSIWNFAQGNVFGFEVSGNPKFASVFSASVKEGYDWFHGGAFGPEGGLAVTVLLMIALLGALMLPTKD